MKLLAMMAWVSLLGSDPLVDPWENSPPARVAIGITDFYEASDAASWRLDDNELLDPFSQD